MFLEHYNIEDMQAAQQLSIPNINIYKPRHLPDIVIALVMLLVTIFSEHIAPEIYVAINSLVGHILLFSLVPLIMYYKGPIFGIIATIMVLVLYSKSLTVSEHYADYQYRKYNDKHLWFVEKVLGEKPKAIEFEKVETLAANN
jgi:hypothetical protein